MQNLKSWHLVQALLIVGALFGMETALAADPIKLGKYDVWTVYGFGNAQALQDTFRALNNLANSGLLRAVFTTMAVIGVLIVGLTSAFQMGGGRKFMGYLVGVFLLSYILFGPTNGGPLTVRIDVVDTVEKDADGAPIWKAPVEVPAVIGIPAALVSTLGIEMTELIERTFNLNDAFKLSKGAPFNLPGALLADASQARIADPNLASSLAYYVQDCFTVGVATGALNAQTLIKSTNFIQDIHFPHTGVMVISMLESQAGTANLNMVSQPELVTCDRAWELIDAAVTAQGGPDAAGYLLNASAWSKTPALSVVNAGADALAQYISNNGISNGGALVKQSAMLSAFKDAHSQAAVQTGNSEFLTGLAMAQATEAQRTSWITGAEVFNKTMGYIYAILQVFVYSVSGLLLFAIVIPGLGVGLLKNFAQILLWLALWQPMLAIVNFVVISLQQSGLTTVMSNGAGDYGFTMSNLGIVSEKSANFRAAATFVGTMVPALAWGMVKGSLDFSRVIGSAMGENFAQGAANTMTTGNYSLNQASMDSFTSNKHSIASTGAFGHGQTTNSTIGAAANEYGGQGSTTVGDQKLGMTVSSNIGANKAQSKGDQVQVADMGGQTLTASQQSAIQIQAAAMRTGGLAALAAVNTALSANGGLTGTAAPPALKAGGKPIPGQNNVPGTAVTGEVAGQQGQLSSADMLKFDKSGVLSKAAAAMGLNLQGYISVLGSAMASQTNSNSYQNMHSRNDSGSTTDSSNRSWNRGKTGTRMRNAGSTDGTSEGVTQNVSAIASGFDRAMLAEAYDSYRSSNSFLAVDNANRGIAPPPQRTSELANEVQKLSAEGAVPNLVAQKNQEIGGVQKKLDGEAGQLMGEADKRAKKIEAGANKLINDNTDATDKSEAAAKKPPSKEVIEQAKGVINQILPEATPEQQAAAKAEMERVKNSMAAGEPGMFQSQ